MQVALFDPVDVRRSSVAAQKRVHLLLSHCITGRRRASEPVKAMRRLTHITTVRANVHAV